MGKKDPRVDAYIEKAADFAKPILKRIRKVVHAACPPVEETLKWRMPFFTHEGILCGVAAFKEHCAFIVWHGQLRPPGKDGNKADNSLGQYGRITSLAELPSDAEIARLIKAAIKLNQAGFKRPAPKSKSPRSTKVPSDLAGALKKHSQARATFEKLSPAKKRDYIEWLEEAKRPETRASRLATAVTWLSEGKSRNWKYESKRSP